MKKSPSSLKEEDLDSYDVDDAENKDTTTNAKPLCEEDEESERKFQSLGKLIVLIIIMVRNMRPTYLPKYRYFFTQYIVITKRSEMHIFSVFRAREIQTLATSAAGVI